MERTQTFYFTAPAVKKANMATPELLNAKFERGCFGGVWQRRII